MSDAEVEDEQKAIQYKNEGNALLLKDDFRGAIAFYTKAIAADPNEGKFYSNRSTAYQKLAKAAKDNSHYKSAVADADKCIELAPEFYKGHLHKTNSLWALGQYAAAATAAAAGLTACPKNDKLTKVYKKMKVEAEKGTVAYVLTGTSANTKRSTAFPLSLMMVYTVLVYLNPLGSPESTQGAFRHVMMMSIVDIIIHLLTTHGRPRFNMYYAGSLIKDSRTQQIFLCALMISARPPKLLALVPATYPAFVNVFCLLHDVFAATITPFASLLRMICNAVVVPLVPGMSGQPVSSRKQFLDWKLLRFSAHMELVLGLWLLVELATPMRNFMTCIFMWQFLRVRYMIDSYSQQSFGVLNSVLETIFGFGPGFLLTGYKKFASFLHNMGKMPEQPDPSASSAGGGGIMSRLTSSCAVQ